MRSEERFKGLDALIADRGGALLATATLLAGGPMAGEDLLQAALERVMRHWHRVKDEPEIYLRRTIYHLAVDQWWSRRRHPEVLGKTGTELDVAVPAGRDRRGPFAPRPDAGAGPVAAATAGRAGSAVLGAAQRIRGGRHARLLARHREIKRFSRPRPAEGSYRCLGTRKRPCEEPASERSLVMTRTIEDLLAASMREEVVGLTPAPDLVARAAKNTRIAPRSGWRQRQRAPSGWLWRWR